MNRIIGFAVVITLLLMGGTAQAVVTECVSVNSLGVPANGLSFQGNMSEDGRYVVFESDGNNLVINDTNGVRDIFVFDRQTGLTERVSLSSGNPGTQANGASCEISPKDNGVFEIPLMSADGRYVVFTSSASNLVSGDTNGLRDIFVRDRVNHTTTRVSVSTSGTQANGVCYFPSISANGNRVVFLSDATNLVSGDTNGAPDVFMRDIPSGQTYRVNVSSAPANAQAVGPYAWNGNDGDMTACISGDGQHVAFVSSATNLVPDDENDMYDVFVRDLNASNPASGTTENVHISTSGEQGNGFPWAHACYISNDGSIVTFSSDADNLVSGDTNGIDDIFVRDRNKGTTTKVSGAIGGGESIGKSTDPSCSADGSLIGYGTWNDDKTLLDCYIVEKDGTGLQQIALDSTGLPLEGLSVFPFFSSNGRYVALFNAPSMSDLGACRVMVVDRSAITVSEARSKPDNSVVIVAGGAVSSASSGEFYFNEDGIAAERTDFSVRVVWSSAVVVGKRYIVTGTMKTTGSERYIQATAVDPHTSQWTVGVRLTIGQPSATTTVTGPITYKITYANAASISLAPSHVTLNKTGTANASVAVTGTGTTRTVTLSGITGNGNLGISIAAGSALNAGGNAPAAGPSGTFAVTSTAPTLVSVSPASGTVQTGAWKTFTCIYSDPNGASDLAMCELLVNSTASNNGGARLMYSRSANKLYMRNNAGVLTAGVTS